MPKPLYSTGSLVVSPVELNLTYTLIPGQTFRWKLDDSDIWVGVVHSRMVRVWREGTLIRYEVWPPTDEPDFIHRYFRLEVNLSEICVQFIQADPFMEEVIRRFSGLRIVKQNPEETLFSYICSAVNSVGRISNAIELMSRRWGERLTTPYGAEYYGFPNVQVLARADVDELCSHCGLGFRGSLVKSAACQLSERSDGWLESLREASYAEARRELLAITGVGPKIADCVLLFSLGKDEAVPVDTHVHHIVSSRYLPELRGRPLTSKVYQCIADFLRVKFGSYAGWAQEYLFYYDLFRRGE